MLDDPLVSIEEDRDHSSIETRYRAIGASFQGRLLVVVLAVIDDHTALIISARRPMRANAMTTKTVKPESPGVTRLRQMLARPRGVGIIGARPTGWATSMAHRSVRNRIAPLPRSLRR